VNREFSGKIIDVFRRRIYGGVIRIVDGKINSIIESDDIEDVYILPGLIDSHVHIESSMLIPTEFSRLVVPRGTVAVVSDPHEIANVHGVKGVEFMLQNAKRSPLKMFFGAPSCVPATEFETNGAVIGHEEIKYLLSNGCIVLSEMMNFPGVISGDKEVMKKIEVAKSLGKKIDGHALGLSNHDLRKYVEAGISTDHECSTLDEALEKIDLGMKILIREGSAAKNFEALSSLIETHTNDVMLCTDDSHPDELLKIGHIDKLIKRGLKKGYSIFDLLTVASVNPVKHYGLPVGLLRIGDPADFICVDDLENFNVTCTFIDGEPVYERGKNKIISVDEIPLNHFNASKIKKEDIKVYSKGCKTSINVIEAFDGDLFTKKFLWQHNYKNGEEVRTDTDLDILKIVVVNRYIDSKPAVGFIRNFGLKSGAIGGSIAHDSHNIILIGVDDESIVKVCNRLIDMKGGIALIDPSLNVIEELALPYSGLMTNEDGIKVAEKYDALNKKAKELGCGFHAPFMTLAFMSLLVIPEIKIGDKGLFDVTSFNFIPIFENGNE
jgi:adenine deaminase